ncbi:MAG: PIN domain-containing protein [Chloroflexota bacterium]|nr:PIN domain-containing protein [Chloroflexota bacterium]
MVTLDSSAVIELSNRAAPQHQRVRAALLQAGRPYFIPCGVLAEITFLLERASAHAADAFLSDLQSGRYTLDCGERDFARIRQLVERYADLPLGAADASVIACAERHGGRVLTLDRRDFGVVAREGALTLLP